MMTRITTTVFCCFLFFLKLAAQDSVLFSIPGKDAGSMQYYAQSIIKNDLNQLLNNIATETESSNIESYQNGSYTVGDRNRIFLNPNIIIRDDINPAYKNNVSSNDIDVKKYLKDLDVLYNKSNNNSIVFNILKVSNPKKGGTEPDIYPFIKVYYTSFFRNKFNSGEEYTRNNRVADIRMIKENGKWNGYIQSITFFNPEDTVQNYYLNDISLISAVGMQGDDSLRIQEQQKAMADELEERTKADNELRKKYNDYISEGDAALEKNDFTACFAAYGKAKETIRGDNLATIKIKKATDLQNAAKYKQEQNAANYAKDAANEEIKRNYQEAARLYRLATITDITLKDKYQSIMDELDTKWQAINSLRKKSEYITNPNDLLVECDKAIKDNPNNSDLYIERARCYDKLTKLPKAIADCDMAIKYDKNNLVAYKLRAELKRKRNEKNDKIEALSDYDSYINIYPGDSSVYASESDLILIINPTAFDKSIEPLDAGIKQNNKWGNLHYKKGWIQLQKKDYLNAKKSFTNTILADSSYALAYFQRGVAEMESDDIEKGASDFRKAIDKNLDAPYLEKIDGYAKTYYDESINKSKEAKTDEAIKMIDKSIGINPSNSEYHFKKGEYLITLGKNEDAINELTKAIGQNGNYTEAYYARGDARMNLKKYNEAAQDYLKVVNLNERHLAGRKRLGDALFAQKEYSGAGQSYQGFITTLSGIKNAPETYMLFEVYNMLGKSLYILNNNNPQALDAFTNSIKNKADFAEAYFNRGVYNLMNNNIGDAIKDLEKAVQITPNNAEWDFQLAQAYREKSDFQNAITYYNNCIKDDASKKYQEAFYQLGKSYFGIQNYDNAITNYQQAQSRGIKASIKMFNYDLGNAYLNVTKPDSAFLYLKNAFSKDSTNENIIYAFGIAQLQKGNQDEALRLFEKAFQTQKFTKKQVKKDLLLHDFIDDKRMKDLMSKYL